MQTEVLMYFYTSEEIKITEINNQLPEPSRLLLEQSVQQITEQFRLPLEESAQQLALFVERNIDRFIRNILMPLPPSTIKILKLISQAKVE